MMMNDLDFAYEDDDRNRHRRRRREAGVSSQQWASQPQQPGWGYPNGAPQEPHYGYSPPNQPGWGQQQPGYDPGYGQGYAPGYDPNYGGQPGYPGYDQGYPPGYDQGYDQGYQQGPPTGHVYGGGNTPTRGSSKKKKKKKKSKGFAIAMTLVLLIRGGGGYFAYTKVAGMLITPDFEGEGQGEVTIEIKQGASGSAMAKTLYDAGVIASTKAFIEAWDKSPDEAAKIQPGTYKLRKEMSAVAAMALLLKPESRVKSGITIPEGLSTFKIYKLLAEKLKLPEADFKAAAADPVALGVPENWFARKDGKASATRSIEGFLFPDTYEFPPSPTAKGVLEIMVKRCGLSLQDNNDKNILTNDKLCIQYAYKYEVRYCL
jgi:hypothetical protein